MEIHFGIEPTNGQKAAWELCHNPKNKTVVLCWSRQSGKSVLCEMLLIEYLFKKNTYNVYISPTFQLGRKVFKEITQLLEPTNIIKKANSSTLTIETIYGSTLQFFSAESYTAIRGTTCNGVCIIDEAAYIQDVLPNGENFWGNVVMPITKARKPLTVLVSTPCGTQGFFYDFYLRALNNEEGIVQLTRDIYADSLVTPKEIEEIKKSIPPKAFLQEFECKFISSSLSFFEGFDECFETFNYEANREYCGLDISANGQDETILTRINAKGQVKIHKIEGTLDVKYAKIAKLLNEINPIATLMENNGVGAPFINEVKKLVKRKSNIYEWTTTNSSKEEIISDLAVKIVNKEVHFNKEDTELYSQFGTFICKISKTKKLTFGAQEGKKDDMIMATAIALKAREDFKNIGINPNNFVRTNTKIFI